MMTLHEQFVFFLDTSQESFVNAPVDVRAHSIAMVSVGAGIPAGRYEVVNARLQLMLDDRMFQSADDDADRLLHRTSRRNLRTWMTENPY